MRILIAVVLFWSFTPTIFACSPTQGYEVFLPKPVPTPMGKSPDPPIITVKGIRRGSGGNPGLCEDMGSLVLKIENHKHLTGYQFERADGDNQYIKIHPGYIAPRLRQKEIRFTWVDAAPKHQKSIKQIIRVVAVSYYGVKSDPIYFEVNEHARK